MVDHILLGLDVGGSSIKAGLVDTLRGQMVTPLQSVPMPNPSTPEAVLALCAQVDRDLGAKGAIGLAFPSAITQGIAHTAANVDQRWVGFAGGAHLSSLVGRPVTFLNDAGAAGLAEISAGAGKGVEGLVMLLTFGTGIGSAMFINGEMLPVVELGHMEMRGGDAEWYASARVRTVEKLDWPAWCERVNDYLARVHRLFWPDLFIIGGSVVENFAEFGHLLKSPTPIRPAVFGPQAGVVGAAFAAARLQAR